MRLFALLVVVLPCVVFAQTARPTPAPKPAAPKDDTSKDDTSKDDKPKGRIIDPWGHLPHPRDHMRLPDPRKAAEKATGDGTVAPAPAAPPDPATSPRDPQLTAEPAAAVPAPAPEAPTVPALPPPPTPFRVTTMRIVPAPPPAPHEGLTIEAGTGIGWIHVSDRVNTVTSPGGTAGLSIGIGGWLDEHLALTARMAGSSVPEARGLVVAAFLGPSLQIWVGERTWFAVGVGIAAFGLEGKRPADDFNFGGYAGDFRLGHTFYASGKHTLTGSFELTPGRVSQDDGYGNSIALSVTSIGLLFGYQYL